MDSSLIEVVTRPTGICFYGMAAPRGGHARRRVPRGIVARQLQRLGTLKLDGLIVSDIQDEGERIAGPGRFPFYPPSTQRRTPIRISPIDRAQGGLSMREPRHARDVVRWLAGVNRRSDLALPSSSARPADRRAPG